MLFILLHNFKAKYVAKMDLRGCSKVQSFFNDAFFTACVLKVQLALIKVQSGVHRYFTEDC